MDLSSDLLGLLRHPDEVKEHIQDKVLGGLVCHQHKGHAFINHQLVILRVEVVSDEHRKEITAFQVGIIIIILLNIFRELFFSLLNYLHDEVLEAFNIPLLDSFSMSNVEGIESFEEHMKGPECSLELFSRYKFHELMDLNTSEGTVLIFVE